MGMGVLKNVLTFLDFERSDECMGFTVMRVFFIFICVCLHILSQ